MQVIIPIVVIGAIVVLAGVVLLARRRSSHRGTTPTAPAGSTSTAPARTTPEPPPMNDLESALAKVTDSTGRSIRDRIDAESQHVDELRVADDTGPLLRRALDHVERPVAGDEPPNPPDPSG